MVTGMYTFESKVLIVDILSLFSLLILQMLQLHCDSSNGFLRFIALRMCWRFEDFPVKHNYKIKFVKPHFNAVF